MKDSKVKTATLEGIDITNEQFQTVWSASPMSTHAERDGDHGLDLAIIVDGRLRFHSFVDENNVRHFRAIKKAVDDDTNQESIFNIVDKKPTHTYH